MQNINLDLIGSFPLAEHEQMPQRPPLPGNASWLDSLILCPGLHRQHLATELNRGEYPATAALTTGYVFRVENQATVYFLQNIGKTGHLTTLSVKTKKELGYSPPNGETLVIAILVSLTVACVSIMLARGSWWDIGIFAIFMTARLLNVVAIRRRSSSTGWKGVHEPGVRGDLLILLSQDRWIRMQGLVDNLKAVTSGQWLRDATSLESTVISAATLLTYLAAALAINASQLGKFVLLFLFVTSAGLLAASNSYVHSLHMSGCIIRSEAPPKAYKRRLDLANQLIAETGRDDWAMRLGMINSKQRSNRGDEEANTKEPVTM